MTRKGHRGYRSTVCQMTVNLHRCAGGADRFVIVDTETTGVYPADRIVEIALITLSLSGEVVDVFETLINPGRDVAASHIHGITASMVRRRRHSPRSPGTSRCASMVGASLRTTSRSIYGCLSTSSLFSVVFCP